MLTAAVVRYAPALKLIPPLLTVQVTCVAAVFNPTASLLARAVVKYAPALCRAVVMLLASPKVIVLALLLADKLEPTAKLIVPLLPFNCATAGCTVCAGQVAVAVTVLPLSPKLTLLLLLNTVAPGTAGTV